ncbi:MAG: hypothetical protein U0930_15550 [Pirellulales bacterium]
MATEIMDGKIRSIGQDRAIVLDVVRYASTVPSFPVERWVDVGHLAELRQLSPRRVSWTALFVRAYGLASREHSVLRQIFVAWPWARIYQSPTCVISLAVNRSQPDGSERLFFGRIHSPDQRGLGEIQADIDGFQKDDPRVAFRSQWRGAKMPSLIRRLAWWWRMDIDYPNRPRRSGTGSISALAGQGVTNRLHPCIMTSSLSFGPVEQDGRILVTLQCDHRVIDGAAAARALNSLCGFLTGQIAGEVELRGNENRSAA